VCMHQYNKVRIWDYVLGLGLGFGVRTLGFGHTGLVFVLVLT